MSDDKVKSQVGWNLENSYAKLPEMFFKVQHPSPVKSPKLVILNHPLVATLGLNVEHIQTNEGIAVLSGNSIPDGAIPISQAYAGHQFGHFTMLGDGRAVLIGEQITPLNEKYDIQYKGSGRTPYSRGGDGRAALGPMLREYIISEAMHALGIPTTRSLSVLTTGELVRRENDQIGAIMTRVASSHIRVGTFEYASRFGTIDDLKSLADYSINRHFPEINNCANKYESLLKQVIERQAKLIAKWQLVGFIHGVMNTDNMTISGETIDYGPCAFMDIYDLDTVFSSIDIHGRYAYGNQSEIAKWNLTILAKTLLPLLHDNEDEAIGLAQDALSDFSKIYNTDWLYGMRSKLGIFNEEPQDEELIGQLLIMMKKYKMDYTNTFVSLTFDKLKDIDVATRPDVENWHQKWQERIRRQKETLKESHEMMLSNNPAIIPRNHKVEEALLAATKYEDYNVMKRLLDVLGVPYAHTLEQADYSKPPLESSSPYRTFCGT